MKIYLFFENFFIKMKITIAEFTAVGFMILIQWHMTLSNKPERFNFKSLEELHLWIWWKSCFCNISVAINLMLLHLSVWISPQSTQCLQFTMDIPFCKEKLTSGCVSNSFNQLFIPRLILLTQMPSDPNLYITFQIQQMNNF